MRRVLLVPVLALVVLAPSGVQAAEDDLLVCDAPPEGTDVLMPGETISLEPAAPQYDAQFYTYTDVSFQLDLYPATASDTATVTSTLSWELDLNNWDLILLDGEGNELAASELFQAGPLGDAPTESISRKLKHCSLFTVSIENEQGIALDELDPLQLQIGSGSVL